MLQPWMIPLSLVIGLVGTRTALHARHFVKAAGRGWLLILLLAWSPLVCWMASQVVLQD